MDNTTVIVTIKSDTQNITVENKFKEVNLVPDFGGTTIVDIIRVYPKLIK